ncbi:hypothetical protein Ade02nite_96610 [Paractinoplanes deccanensis]|uniref:Uncharacterized protein n=1 Tax=Paractinoplanes deccanensis TaxID=113561 RepID=A0ABQ3YLY1_9ACTN|nr:hypothetical protein Ade02nite_96610 [Actinoplanes deccanensis]
MLAAQPFLAARSAHPYKLRRELESVPELRRHLFSFTEGRVGDLDAGRVGLAERGVFAAVHQEAGDGRAGRLGQLLLSMPSTSVNQSRTERTSAHLGRNGEGGLIAAVERLERGAPRRA